MKKHITLFFLINSIGFACGPYFPPSYINDLDAYYIENINIPMELLLIAREYELIDDTLFPSSNTPTVQADLAEFTDRATELELSSLIAPYTEYAQAIRKGAPDQTAPEVPQTLSEFTLYLEGYREMQIDSELLKPKAWEQLLELEKTNRMYRTTWVYYMLGNLAGSHEKPALASKYYGECRQALKNGYTDSIGLAHASFKNEFLVQTNTNKRVMKGVQAIAYYQYSNDKKKLSHCLEHLSYQTDITPELNTDPVYLEIAALLLSNSEKASSTQLLDTLRTAPHLNITPRLAWFMYKRGDIELAKNCLKNCPADDVLANWLRFRIATRDGRPEKALNHLKKWIYEIQESDRIVHEFQGHGLVSSTSSTFGALGKLFISQNQMQDALVCFVKAGSYPDAALIAERYVETETLMVYIDSFQQLNPETENPPQYQYRNIEQSQAYIQDHLSYLFARRLFRENRATDALPYYPPAIEKIVQTYLDARTKADNIWSSANTRGAHLFHAARLMRWKGMEMSGTEMAPDYSPGAFSYAGIQHENLITTNAATLYTDTAPSPDIRYHYRHVAARLAGQAAKLTRNRNQKAAILWTAGEWIKLQYPQEADVYYKQLAKISFQPLAKAADQERWFPKPTSLLEEIYRSEDYLSPKILSNAAREYAQ